MVERTTRWIVTCTTVETFQKRVEMVTWKRIG